MNIVGDSQSRYRGWAIYRVARPSSFGLYTVKLLPFQNTPLDHPIIVQEHPIIVQGNGINGNHVAVEISTHLNWPTYKDKMMVFLRLWSDYIRLKLSELAVDTCYISRRDEEDVYGFHISECDWELSRGDSIFAENHDERKVYIGDVRLVTMEMVEAEMPTQFRLRPGIKYAIRFEHRLLPFQIQQHALLDIITWGQNILFPPNSVRRMSRPPLVQINGEIGQWVWHNAQMNDSQKQAIIKVLKGEYRPLPYLISGPPGTGKTSTLVEYVNQVYKHLPNAKILICAPSNTAANVILEKLAKSRWINPTNNKKNKEKIAVEEPLLIRMLSYTAVRANMIPRHLLRYCGTLPMEEAPEGLRIISELDQLERYRIVITTVNYTGNFLRMGMHGYFTHLIMDEAGQALETESLIPLSLMKGRDNHISMFGDEKQLGPVVKCKHLKRMHFDISMFERLSALPVYQNEEIPLYSRLINNYRSVPSLLNYYNRLFYQERLIAMVTDNESAEFRLLRQLDSMFPAAHSRLRYRSLYFKSVLTPSYVFPGTYSLHNPGEVVKVVEFYRSLLDKGVHARDVGVITPYRMQSREIKKAIEEARLQLPKVGTTEIFQGDQRMIMLMSTVRSFRGESQSTQNIQLRFVNDPKRINVSISRARALLVIFGNNRVLSGANHWQRLISMAEEESTLLH